MHVRAGLLPWQGRSSSTKGGRATAVWANGRARTRLYQSFRHLCSWAIMSVVFRQADLRDLSPDPSTHMYIHQLCMVKPAHYAGITRRSEIRRPWTKLLRRTATLRDYFTISDKYHSTRHFLYRPPISSRAMPYLHAPPSPALETTGRLGQQQPHKTGEYGSPDCHQLTTL